MQEKIFKFKLKNFLKFLRQKKYNSIFCRTLYFRCDHFSVPLSCFDRAREKTDKKTKENQEKEGGREMAGKSCMRDFFLERERETLSVYATLTAETKGRERPEESSEVRTDFQRDRDRILHSQSFRRLMNKTQVFLAPTGDHYRTRMTHTLEVTQIARIIARALRLNEDLTEAAALGHDTRDNQYC